MPPESSESEKPQGAEVTRFAWERALRAAPDVAGTQMLVLLTLATWMDSDGTNGRPGQALLAQVTGLSERTVRGHLASAVEDGWLQCTSRGHGSRFGAVTASCYRATIPAEAATTGATVPVVEDDNRNPPAGSGLQPAPQPAAGRSTTGTGVPPTKDDHEDQERAPLDIARTLVAKQRGELPGLLDALTSQHGHARTRAALAHLAASGARYHYPSELKRNIGDTIAAVARAELDAEADATRRRLADVPQHINPSQAEQVRQARAEIFGQKAS